MTFNGSGIRDIQRVLGVSIAGILMKLRVWFKTVDAPSPKDILNVFKLMRCGLLSNTENKVKDGFGTPMTQILVKF